MTPEAFAELVLPAALDVHAATALPASFLIGQWAHETGFGESPAARIDQNFAGLKPWWGDSRPGVTGYNRYTDLADWALGYIAFVTLNDLYRPALEAAAAGRSTFDVASLMSPWVGIPGQIDQLTGQVITSGYGDAISAIIRETGLTRYDAGVAALDPADVRAAILAPGGYGEHLELEELGPMKKQTEELVARISALELQTEELVARISALELRAETEALTLLRQIAGLILQATAPPGA